MTDVRGARIVRLIEDPLVGGDLLLVAVGLAAKYDFDFGLGGRLAALLWPDKQQRVAAAACGVETVAAPMASWKIQDVFRRDIRTYKPVLPLNQGCTAPMMRRDGECGKSAAISGFLTDWSTGEKTFAGGCRRHYDWFNAQHQANWQAKPDLVPLPCANHGGALRPHFPQIDWPGFWKQLDPTWVEHPEATSWPKPTFTLVLGDADGGAAVGRPDLSAVPLDGLR